MTVFQRIPRGWWTVLVGTASFVAFGLMFLVSSPGGGSMLAFEVGILLVALVGGALAQRWIDTLALGTGLAVAMETQAIVQSLPPDVPDDLPWLMLGVVWVPALLLTGLASIAFALGPRLDRKGPAAAASTTRIPRLGCLGRLIGGIVVAVALGSIFVLRTSYQTTPSIYRIIGEQDIEVVVTGGNLTWCRITSVLETEADVTVDAACVNLWLGPQTAVGIPTTLAVHLTRPLADRIIRDVFGYPVRRDPPASHAVDQDRAASIAREVLRTERPDVADSATKLMDLALDRGPSGRPAWKANMIVIEEPPASPGFPSSIWMWIDAESGVVTIISRT